jgi:hypothetical protein
VQGDSLACAGAAVWAQLILTPGTGNLPTVVERSTDSGSSWGAVGGSTTAYAPLLPSFGDPGPFVALSPDAAIFSFTCNGCNASGNGQTSAINVLGTANGGQSFVSGSIPVGGIVPRAVALPGDGSVFVQITRTQQSSSTADNDIFFSPDGGSSWAQQNSGHVHG